MGSSPERTFNTFKAAQIKATKFHFERSQSTTGKYQEPQEKPS